MKRTLSRCVQFLIGAMWFVAGLVAFERPAMVTQVSWWEASGKNYWSPQSTIAAVIGADAPLLPTLERSACSSPRVIPDPAGTFKFACPK